MKIRLIKESSIKNYAANNPQCRAQLEEWLRKIKSANWNYPIDILQNFPSADLLGNGSNRIVFDITGNRFRLICEYRFGGRKVRLYVCWIGTHTQYTRFCQEGRQYTICNY
jgi:mRNA interferase HigB